MEIKIWMRTKWNSNLIWITFGKHWYKGSSITTKHYHIIYGQLPVDYPLQAVEILPCEPMIFFHYKLYTQSTESQTIELFYRPRNWQVGVLLIEEALYCNDTVNITIDNDDNKDWFTAGKSSVLLQLIIIYNNEVQSRLTTMMFNHYQLNDTNTMFLLNKIHIPKGYIYIYITQLVSRKQIYQ